MCFLKLWPRGRRSKINRRGPSTEPWGTPEATEKEQFSRVFERNERSDIRCRFLESVGSVPGFLINGMISDI